MIWISTVLALVRSSRVARYVFLVAGMVAAVGMAVLMAFVRGNARGRARIDHEYAKKSLERRDARDEVDRSVNRDPDPNGQLLKHWSRD
ncbi:hypothetical protein UFOVP1414_55 [uncultured Caudovirales phage]|uniref:Uncharacterized protein n=1 Tax=uncultured Caudovirales phage TaxID=2100421 RepID=A0A6J5MBE4_9CAUD|nr:hypothetical protein UFOVP442_22 [uncultured Caudovirales phage]CAB4211943.1 hypothetical protein UFOVP1414_55 [uncultured Caudovirales phage]